MRKNGDEGDGQIEAHVRAQVAEIDGALSHLLKEPDAMTDRPPQNDMMERAKAEFKGMAQQGLDHPSTKPVLTGAAIGAVAGFVLPVVSVPVGLIAGAAFMFWQRLKPLDALPLLRT